MPAPPFTFVAQTIARSAEVNTNFEDIYNVAVFKTGDTMTGTLNTQHLLPALDATYDLGSASFRYRNLYLSGSIVGPGAVNSFGTIAVSGQSDVVADSANDTLTLAAGAGVTITTTPGSDTVTIAASGATAGSLTVRSGGVIYDSHTPVGNVGTGEDTLQSQVVAASTLANDGESLHFRARGTMAANLNNKRVRVKWGATTILDTGNIDAASTHFVIDGSITRTGASAQQVEATFVTTLGGLSDAGVTTAGEVLGGAVTFSITGEAVATDDIICLGFKMWWEPTSAQ